MAKQQLKPNPSKTRNPIRAAAAALNSVADLEIPAFLSDIRTQTLLLFGLAALLYANTLGHGFVQDDAIVINDNMFTKQGFGGINGILTKDTFFGFFKVEGKDMLVSGGRYRPFTLVLFAMIYQFFGDNPFPYHLLTVVLFATTVAVLYRTLLVMFSPKGEGYAALVAWMAALLFAVHPIHTEVVANIKGCDEIVTLLGSLIATWLVFKSLDTGKAGYSIGAAVAFFLACLSKENAATFVVVIPLALYFFRPNIGIGKIITQNCACLGCIVLFFILRGSILQWKFGASAPELMNNPYLKFVGNGWTPFSAAERLATIIYTLGKYILLLIVPHPLTHDYYPRHIGIMNFGNAGVLASLAAYIGLIWYALTGWTKRNPIAFGILYFVLTLSIVSNLVFPVGTNMGERFAFMPSVGYCIIASVLLAGLLRSADGWVPSKIKIMLIFLGTIGVLYAFKTVTRNPVWESNEKIIYD